MGDDKRIEVGKVFQLEDEYEINSKELTKKELLSVIWVMYDGITISESQMKMLPPMIRRKFRKVKQ